MVNRSSTRSTAYSLTQTTSVDRAIAGVIVAGVTFFLGYTVVRASLAQTNPAAPTVVDNDVEVVVPGEGTLWKDVGTRF
ncbi:hypothetical protein S7335_1930 [Synechococcus sp. PCC 7335]|uniref:hypothetical protein n=1 Tax=Synechococcus sp. (strain ATCC 29403 / PCC 7335) TaxID=91464 RepID=UPI00017ED94B|nr:hypothetical protein [Synechococcus sp. PCC 7335]EDX84233.1 hypothetical protein S7335_1930 [Synechococcus sp. PCC 7335]